MTAQPPFRLPERVKFDFPAQHVMVLLSALQELPFKVAAPVLNDIDTQVMAQRVLETRAE